MPELENAGLEIPKVVLPPIFLMSKEDIENDYEPANLEEVE